MRGLHRGWITLAVLLMVAACASSKKGRPAGEVARADRVAPDTVSSAYGAPRANRSRAARVGRVTQQDIDRAGNVSLATFLETRLAGVRVSTNRGESVVRITGMPSDGAALVLIDGTEGTISGLVLQNLSAIEVLKDAAASVYGVRGGNGVLLITTRKR